MSSSFFLTFVSALILIVGLIDDLRSRKIHNKLILVLIPVALLSVGFSLGLKSLITMSLLSGILALCLSLPLYFLKIIGGGDLKLFFTVSLVWESETVLWSLILALPWGAFLGLTRSALQGRSSLVFLNLISLIKFKKIKTKELQTFPFSVVLLLGWLSYRVLSKAGFFNSL